MKLYLLLPILWVMLTVVVIVLIVIRDSRMRAAPPPKSLADRFREANPGIDMDLTQDGVTTQHRPDVLEERAWRPGIIPSDQFVNRAGVCMKCGTFHAPGAEHAR